MNEIRIISGELDINFLIDQIKIFHGKNYLEKYKVYRLIEQFINNKAISLNDKIITDENMIITNDRKYNILRRGKKKYYLLENKK